MQSGESTVPRDAREKPACPDKPGLSGEGARSAMEQLIRQQEAQRRPPTPPNR